MSNEELELKRKKLEELKKKKEELEALKRKKQEEQKKSQPESKEKEDEKEKKEEKKAAPESAEKEKVNKQNVKDKESKENAQEDRTSEQEGKNSEKKKGEDKKDTDEKEKKDDKKEEKGEKEEKQQASEKEKKEKKKDDKKKTDKKGKKTSLGGKKKKGTGLPPLPAKKKKSATQTKTKSGIEAKAKKGDTTQTKTEIPDHGVTNSQFLKLQKAKKTKIYIIIGIITLIVTFILCGLVILIRRGFASKENRSTHRGIVPQTHSKHRGHLPNKTFVPTQGKKTAPKLPPVITAEDVESQQTAGAPGKKDNSLNNTENTTVKTKKISPETEAQFKKDYIAVRKKLIKQPANVQDIEKNIKLWNELLDKYTEYPDCWLYKKAKIQRDNLKELKSMY